MQQEDIATVTAASGLSLFLLSFLVLAGALGCLVIVTPFLTEIACAAILAYPSWPLYKKIRRSFGRYESAAAFTDDLAAHMRGCPADSLGRGARRRRNRGRIEPLRIFSRKSRMLYPPSFATFHGWARNCNSKSLSSVRCFE